MIIRNFTLASSGESVQRAGAGEGTERSLRTVRQTLSGEPLSAHQTSWRLLLLHFRPADCQKRSCPLLRRDGPAHDKGYTRREVYHKGTEISSPCFRTTAI